MKRVLSFVLAFVMVLSMFAGLQISSSALEPTGKCGDNVYWSFDESTGTLTISGEGEMKNYDFSYTPFSYNNEIKSVIIESGITNITRNMFTGCSNLISISIPETVVSIGYGICKECDNLAIIKVDENNECFDSRDNCNGIIETSTNTLEVACSETVIPNGVEILGSFLYENNSKITDIVLPNTVKVIESCAFLECKNLKKIYLPDSLTEIGSQAFSYTALNTIMIPKNVSKLDSSVFYGCDALSEIVVESGNPVYDSRDNCNAVIETSTNKLLIGCTNTVVPAGITNFANNALAYSSFERFIIPNSVVSIGSWAFSHCQNLTEIEIPSSVTSLGSFAFSDCYNLTTIMFTGTKKQWEAIPKVVSDYENYNIIFNYSEHEHHFGEEMVISEPTCSWEGSKNIVCSICGLIRNVPIPVDSKAHLFKNGICSYCSQKDMDYSFPVITGNCTKTIYLSSSSEHYSASFIPEYDGKIMFYSTGNKSTEGVLLEIKDSKTIQRTYDCYHGEGGINFKISSNVNAGNEYILECNLLDTDWGDGLIDYASGDLTFVFEYEPTHIHSYVAIVTNAPTCTEAGVKTSTCSCGDAKTESIPALGHSFGAWTQTKAPTCMATGVETRVCANDASHTETRAIAKTAHTPAAAVKENVKAATCIATGSYDSVVNCAVCGAEISRTKQSSPALGHSWGAWKVTKKATCTAAGTESRTCARDGAHVQSRSIPATGHQYSAKVVKPTSTSLGYTLHSCSGCGESYQDTFKAPTGKQTLKCKARTAAAQTVTWNNVKSATGYQVQISTKDGKKWSTYATLKAGVTNYTFKKLAAGNNYKFRVRFYIKAADGKNYFSPWSTTLNSPTLPVGTTVSKLGAGSKAFTAKWVKVAGVSGYQVQYSTNAKFAGAKAVTVRGATKNAQAVKNLKAGARYYVRIRTYKTVGGKNYFSAWSAAKAVTTKK